jgi:hypothetical protein
MSKKNEKPLAYWNYRVLEETKDNVKSFRIIEVYYEDGNIAGWADNTERILIWDDYNDLKYTCEVLKDAFDLPILKRGEDDQLYEQKKEVQKNN